ncbi:hypothetical protein [Streptomyces sp. NPDC055749]
MESISGVWSFWSRTAAPHESVVDTSYLTSCTANYYPGAKAVNRSSDGLWLEGWANTTTGSTGDKIFRYRLQYENGSGSDMFISFEVNFYTGVLTVSHGPDPNPLLNQRVTWNTDTYLFQDTYHFGWWLKWTGGMPSVVPIITRGTSMWTGTIQSLTTTLSPPGELRAIHLTLTNVRAEALQISQLPARPVTRANATLEGMWTKGATLGVPYGPLATFPRVSGDAWSVITDIARATLSTAEFDRDGFFRWRGYSRWATVPTAPNVTVSATRELGKLTVSEEIDACRNDVTVAWQNWGGYEYELDGVADNPTDPIAISAGGAITRDMPINENQFDPRCPALSADLNGFGNLIVRATASTTSAVVRGAVESSVRREGGTVTLTVRNLSSSAVYYHASNLIATKPGSNTGSPVDSLAKAQHAESQKAYGVQSYKHDGGVWLQYAQDASNVAKALLDASAYPAPLLQNLEILPDPRIDLGDVVRVVDQSGAKLDTLAWVVGNRISGSGGKVTQVLTLRGTKSNGVPADSGLTPDPPTRPNAPPPT